MLFRLLSHRITAAQEAAQAEQARLAREAKAAQRARTAPSATKRKPVKTKTTTAPGKTDVTGEATGEKPSAVAAPKVTADTNDREALRSRVLELRSEGKATPKWPQPPELHSAPAKDGQTNNKLLPKRVNFYLKTQFFWNHEKLVIPCET